MKDSGIINTSIQNNDFDEKAFLEMFGNKRMRAIYQAIADSPKTASQLRGLDIPNTTLYHYLTWLLQKGLVRGMQRNKEESSKILFFPIIKNAIIEFSPYKIKVIKKTEIEQ